MITGTRVRCVWLIVAFAMFVLIGATMAADQRAPHDGKRTADTPTPSQPHAAGSMAETLKFRIKGRSQTVSGRTVIEAADGGIMFQGVDGVLWTVEPNEIEARERLGKPFKAMTPAELAQQLLIEYPNGFRTYTTPHYVVCYNTSRAYAEWTTSLLERLYKAFTNYWQNRGMDIHEPEFPLPVVLFADQQSYDAASRGDLPNGTGTIISFYSLTSNKIKMFDLTGTESLHQADAAGQPMSRRGSIREINQLLSQPAAVPLVSTIVHEATHQIAFNCGMQNRFADIPLWLCEGMAVYFEAPDLASKSGWRGIGHVNYPRLERFRDNLANWHDGSLVEMLRDSQKFRDPKTSIDAYADAWALNYYLLKFQPKAYVAYLKLLAAKPPMVDDEPQKRLAEFKEHFGDPRKVEQDFLKQMSRVK